MPLTAVAAVVIACALATAAGATPDAAGPTIVLESHAGERSVAAAALLAPVLDELAQRGLSARPDAIARRIGHAPAPGILDPGKSAAELVQLVDGGLEAFTTGKFKEAEASLALAVQHIRRNPALLVDHADRRRLTFRALVGLALSQLRLGDNAGSDATMTEVVRMFPATPVARAEYGPQAEQLYKTVHKQSQAKGRGRLRVTVTDERVRLFVDGELRGPAPLALSDLLPGTYRVFAVVPGTSGRQYEIDVRAGAESELAIDWAVDSVLTVSEAWVGLLFANEAAQAKEAAVASALVRRSGGETIAVIGTTQVQGKRAVTATMVHATGDVLRRGFVYAGAGDAALRSLARFAADGAPSPDVYMVGKADLERVTTSNATTTTITTGTGTGGAKLLVGGGVAALFAGVVLFAIDQDPGHTDARGDQTKYYRDTATLGGVSGLVGVAAIGIGVLLWRDRERASSAPVIALEKSRAWIGWTGRF